jgi:hypothetical protein
MQTKIIVRDKDIEISLNKNIYTEPLVKKTCDLFQTHTPIKNTKDKIIITSTDESIALEFFNYLIALRQNGDI